MGRPEDFRKSMEVRTDEEIIFSDFCRYMDELKLENYASIELSQAIDSVFNRLKEKYPKETIKEIIEKRLDNGKYIHRIVRQKGLSPIVQLQLSQVEVKQSKRSEALKQETNAAIEVAFAKVEKRIKTLVKSGETSISGNEFGNLIKQDEMENGEWTWMSFAIDRAMGMINDKVQLYEKTLESEGIEEITEEILNERFIGQSEEPDVYAVLAIHKVLQRQEQKQKENQGRE